MTGNMTLRTDSIYGHSEPFGYDGMKRLTSGSEDSYAYCLNNPLKFIDPSGLQFIYRKREYRLEVEIDGVVVTGERIKYLKYFTLLTAIMIPN